MHRFVELNSVSGEKQERTHMYVSQNPFVCQSVVTVQNESVLVWQGVLSNPFKNCPLAISGSPIRSLKIVKKCNIHLRTVAIQRLVLFVEHVPAEILKYNDVYSTVHCVTLSLNRLEGAMKTTLVIPRWHCNPKRFS